MWLKAVIILAGAGMIYSLVSGFYYLMKDKPGSRRLAFSLVLRIICAIIVIALVIYGLSSHRLHISAPWLGA